MTEQTLPKQIRLDDARPGSGDDDDDDISITSSHSEEYQSDEFEVEAILAEKGRSSKKRYLVYWSNYPIEKSTWEPVENISPELITQWNEQKDLESKGLVEPFDIVAFNTKLRELKERKSKRQRLRKVKRRRQGIQVSPSGSDKSLDGDESSIEAAEENDIKENIILSNQDDGNRMSPTDLPKPSSSSQLFESGSSDIETNTRPRGRKRQDRPTLSPPEKPRQKRASSQSSSEVPLSSNPKKSRYLLSSSHDPSAQLSSQGQLSSHGQLSSRLPPQTQLSSQLNPAAESPTASKPSADLQSISTSSRGISSLKGAKGATRGGSTAARKNVFQNSANPKERRNRSNVSDSSKTPKMFKNMSLQRRAEIRSRNRAEGEPDISALPGGLFAPSDPSSVVPIRPDNLKKTSYTAFSGSEAESPSTEDSPERNELFVSSERSPEPQAPQSSVSTYIPLLPSGLFRATCYFWDRAQRDSSQPACSQGVACKYLHYYDEAIPVAPAPSSVVQRWTCYYWDRAQREEGMLPCSKGSSCPYLHYYQENVRVAPPPPGSNLYKSSALSTSSIKDQAEPLAHPDWDPENPLNAICYFWTTQNKNCSKGTSCKYYHSNDIRLPIAPPPYQRLNRPCKFWLLGSCTGPCTFRHENPSFSSTNTTTNQDLLVQTTSPILRPPSAPRTKSVSFAIDEAIQPFGQAERRTSESRDQTNFEVEARNAMGPKQSNPTQYDIGLEDESLSMASDATLHSLSVSKGDRAKVKPGENTLRIPPNSLGQRAKKITIGGDKARSLFLDFGPFDKELQKEPWGEAFYAATEINFDLMCMAQDFQAQQGFFQRQMLWHGSLLPLDLTDSEAIRPINDVFEELVNRSSGLISASSNFTILVFPTKKEEWRFLEQMFVPTEARLRYSIFQCDLDIKQVLVLKPTNIPIGSSYRDILVGKLHQLDIKRLLPIYKKGQKPYNFYLLFPPTAHRTAQFITSWLRSFPQECKIYHSQDEGSWEFFTKKSGINIGVILIHESIVADIYRLPSLIQLITEKNFVFWALSDSSLPYPLFPSKYKENSTVGQITTTRLFPHGAAFFLTPSFLVAEPDKAYIILQWFLSGKQPKFQFSTPRTWKLVCCHGLSDYILDLANSKASEKEDFERKHSNKPAKDAMLEERGLSFNYCTARYKLHHILVDLDMRNLLEPLSDDDSDYCDDIDCPIVYADQSIDSDNEESLLEWFAMWSIRNLDKFRKFAVVGTGPRSTVRATRLKEFTSPKTSMLTTHSIDDVSSDAFRFPTMIENYENAEKFVTKTKNVKVTGELFDSMDIDTQIHDLIHGIEAERHRLPTLSTAQADATQSQGLFASSFALGATNASGSGTSTLPPQPDGTDGMVWSPQYDGADDGPASPGNESSASSRASIHKSAHSNTPAGNDPPLKQAEDKESYHSRKAPQSELGSEIAGRHITNETSPSGNSVDINSPMGVPKEDGASGNDGPNKSSRLDGSETQEPTVVMKEIKFEPTTSWYNRLKERGGGWEHIFVSDYEHVCKFLGVTK